MLAGYNQSLEGLSFLVADTSGIDCNEPIDTTFSSEIDQQRIARLAAVTTVCQAKNAVYQGTTKIQSWGWKEIYEVLKLCASSGFATTPDGIIPKCLWDVPIAPPLAYYQADPTFVAGFIDGAYSTVGQLFSSAVSILDIATCYSPNVGTFNPSPKCIEIMTKTFETFDMIRELVTNKTVRDQAWVQIKKQAGLQAAKFTKILKAVDNISDQIKVIHHAIHGLGGKFVKTASSTTRGVVEVVMKSGQKVFKCTNGVLSEIRWKTGSGWIESKVLYGVDYINSTGNKVKNGVLKLYKRTNCRLSADAADDACDWAVEGINGKVRLLTKLANFPNLKVWVNSLDEALDAKLLSKIEDLDNDYLVKLEADIVHPRYGATIKELVEENADDLTEIWKRLKEDVGFCWEMRSEGGSRWQKWAQRAAFKDATQKGRAFEDLVLNSIKARSGAWYNKLKQEVATFGINNLDEYEFFDQVQFGFPQRKLPDGSFVDYFIADQVFVKFKTEIVGGVSRKTIDDMVILETKLSQSTSLTPNQNIAKGLNKYTTRGNKLPGIPSGSSAPFNGPIKWIKAYDAGVGNVITDITTKF